MNKVSVKDLDLEKNIALVGYDRHFDMFLSEVNNRAMGYMLRALRQQGKKVIIFNTWDQIHGFDRLTDKRINPWEKGDWLYSLTCSDSGKGQKVSFVDWLGDGIGGAFYIDMFYTFVSGNNMIKDPETDEWRSTHPEVRSQINACLEWIMQSLEVRDGEPIYLFIGDIAPQQDWMLPYNRLPRLVQSQKVQVVAGVGRPKLLKQAGLFHLLDLFDEVATARRKEFPRYNEENLSGDFLKLFDFNCYLDLVRIVFPNYEFDMKSSLYYAESAFSCLVYYALKEGITHRDDFRRLLREPAPQLFATLAVAWGDTGYGKMFKGDSSLLAEAYKILQERTSWI